MTALAHALEHGHAKRWLGRRRTDPLPAGLTIRPGRSGEAPALERLAALDSRGLPEGPFLVAELEGELVAAVALRAGGDSFADPFRPTADIRKLLERQARRLEASRPR